MTASDREGLIRQLRESLGVMAMTAAVPMSIWDRHSNLVLRAVDALAAITPAEDSWRDIATAPKDGTQILVTGINLRGDRYHDIIKWNREWCCFDLEANGYTCPVLPPTHWQPLPPPPKEKNSE